MFRQLKQDVEAFWTFMNEKTKTWYIFSNHDEFIDEDLFNAQFNYLKKKNFKFEKIFFEGKHEIKKEALIKLKSEIDISTLNIKL